MKSARSERRRATDECSYSLGRPKNSHRRTTHGCNRSSGVIRRYAADQDGPRLLQKNSERPDDRRTRPQPSERHVDWHHRPTNARERIDRRRQKKVDRGERRCTDDEDGYRPSTNSRPPDDRLLRPERRRDTAVCSRPKRLKAAPEKR